MTVDDKNSIYVGGLPYNANEDTVRRVFDPYGPIIAVKIINDQGTRGKCYGFVTFRNPRSVIDAINDMNGKTIDGRVVNGVTSRGGRPNVSRDRFRRNIDRDVKGIMIVIGTDIRSGTEIGPKSEPGPGIMMKMRIDNMNLHVVMVRQGIVLLMEIKAEAEIWLVMNKEKEGTIGIGKAKLRRFACPFRQSHNSHFKP